jgi:hypothetical protein
VRVVGMVVLAAKQIAFFFLAFLVFAYLFGFFLG